LSVDSESNQPRDWAILLTAPGASAIAVVRLLGPGVAEFLARHFSGQARESRCIHGELRDENGRFVDDPVVVVLPGSRGADVNLHGGPWVVEECLELARRNGFEVIDTSSSDEPPLDAVDGRDIIESEMLGSLPRVTTDMGLRVLLAQPAAWRALGLAPHSEQRAAMKAILQDRSLHWLLHPPRVALVGAANVGKSTLANRLFARHRSITADVPGTTRDWVGELANLDGLTVMLIDTPGVRPTNDTIERTAINLADSEVRSADLIVIVLDLARPRAEQSEMLSRHPQALRVANKCDLTKQWDPNASGCVELCALDGRGVEELRRLIRVHFGCESLDVNTARCWTPRQREALRRAIG
jgi:tRNA modification GTPase